MQVVAYAMMLENAGHKVAGGFIYYAADKRRVEVVLDDAARQNCRAAIAEAREVAAAGTCPLPLVDDPRCLYCSAYPVCLPNESIYWAAPEEKPTVPTAQAPVHREILVKLWWCRRLVPWLAVEVARWW